MKRLVAIGAIVLGGAVAFQALAQPRRRLAAAVSRRMLNRMEHMMARLPENSPPKLIMSVLPQLREQNEQMVRLLQEQNELLRKHLHTGQSAVGDA